MAKSLPQIMMMVLILLFVAACAGEAAPAQSSSDVAATEQIDTPTSVPTSPPAPTATTEPTPTVEATPTSEVETVEGERDANNRDADNSDANEHTAIDITKPLPVGDPQHGADLLEIKACSGCHFIGRVGAGPSWKAEIYAGGKGIGTRATERWQKTGYTGEATTATEYLVESIVMPNAYVIEGYMGGAMPSTFGELLTEQELADIISYLLEIE